MEIRLGLIMLGMGLAQTPSTFQTYQMVGSSFLDGTFTHWEQARDEIEGLAVTPDGDIVFGHRSLMDAASGIAGHDFPGRALR